MINTVLFDMGGTLEDIWYNDQTIQDVTRKLLTFLQEHDMVTGSNEICFWNKINNGIRRYKQWSEGNALELKPEEIWPQYYLSEFDLDKEKVARYASRAAPGRQGGARGTEKQGIPPGRHLEHRFAVFGIRCAGGLRHPRLF